MNNKFIKYILTFIVIFLIMLFFCTFQYIDNDQVWTYGFSYNISQGLVPYKDYNMIIGPLYSLIFSFPMVLFGNYLFVFKLFHIIFYSIVLTFCYAKLGKKTIFLMFSYFVQNTACWYNVFVATLLIIIFLLIDSNSKYKDLFIGLLIGVILMTKHNIGFFLFIVYFFTSKKKIQNSFYVSIPVFISLLYLIVTDSLFGYINFCFLGGVNFISNFLYDIPTLIILIVIVIYLVKKYIKTKDVKILYLFAVLSVIFPLVETVHLLIFFIPFTYYILLFEKDKKCLYVNYYFLIVGVISIVIQFVFVTHFKYFNIKDNFLKFTFLQNGVCETLNNYSNYMKKIDGNIILFVHQAYSIRLINNQTPGFYDLINKGNLGSNEDYYIEEIDKKCKNEKCTFILGGFYFKKRIKMNQMLFSFKDYVVDNYKYVETLPSGDRVYSNNHEDE